MMFSDTPIVVHTLSPSVRVDEDSGDRPGPPAGVEDPHPVVGEVDVGRAPGSGRRSRCRSAASRALTGPLPSAVATMRSSSMITLTVASVIWPAVVVGDHPVRLELEEVRLPSRGPAQQQLERAVGNLEVVARVLEPLEGLEHRAERLGVELEAELLGLQREGRAPGQLRHDKARAVADRVRRRRARRRRAAERSRSCAAPPCGRRPRCRRRAAAGRVRG